MPCVKTVLELLAGYNTLRRDTSQHFPDCVLGFDVPYKGTFKLCTAHILCSVDTQRRASVLWQCITLLVWLYRNHSVFEVQQWRRAGRRLGRRQSRTDKAAIWTVKAGSSPLRYTATCYTAAPLERNWPWSPESHQRYFCTDRCCTLLIFAFPFQTLKVLWVTLMWMNESWFSIIL